MVAVRRIGQRADLGNDADRRFVGGDDDSVDLVQAIPDLRMQRHSRFASGLRVKFGREADFEQHVFHHVAAIGAGETEGTPVFGLERQVVVGVAERHVVEAPLPGGQHPGNAHLATHRDVRQTHTSTGRIARRPGFA
ncbi:hypothetical protein D9M68_900060 [compost metagenome]